MHDRGHTSCTTQIALTIASTRDTQAHCSEAHFKRNFRAPISPKPLGAEGPASGRALCYTSVKSNPGREPWTPAPTRAHPGDATTTGPRRPPRRRLLRRRGDEGMLVNTTIAKLEALGAVRHGRWPSPTRRSGPDREPSCASRTDSGCSPTPRPTPATPAGPTAGYRQPCTPPIDREDQAG